MFSEQVAELSWGWYETKGGVQLLALPPEVSKHGVGVGEVECGLPTSIGFRGQPIISHVIRGMESSALLGATQKELRVSRASSSPSLAGSLASPWV